LGHGVPTKLAFGARRGLALPTHRFWEIDHMGAIQARKMVYQGLTTLALFLASAGPTYADVIYKVDDGTPEFLFGVQPADMIWLNRFSADPANNLITTISVAFGIPASLNGKPITLAIWADTDGNPADALLLNTAQGVVANAGTFTFNDYAIPPTLVNGNFFVGLEITTLQGQFPALIDTDNPQHQSFWAGSFPGFGNLAHLGANFFPVESIDAITPGNFLIRATGTADVPEPGSLALMGLGGLALLGYRRWRRTTAAAPRGALP
jgi:hypothetical protein